MKKFFLVFTILFSIAASLNFVFADDISLFKDTKNHWGEKYITLLSLEGVIDGKTKDTFDPNGLVTREQFIKMLMTSFRDVDTTADGELLYKDVPLDRWSAPYIDDAYYFSILEKDSQNFYPDTPITREQCAIWTVRALEEIFGKTEAAKNTKFTDNNKINDKESIAKAVNYGIITGYEDNTFRPTGNLTRAEAAVICTKFKQEYYDLVEKQMTNPVSKTQEKDLNGDGKAEKINFTTHANFIYKLEVNGSYATHYAEELNTTLFFMDLDKKDKYIEVSVTSYGPSADFLTEIYRYTGDYFYQVGKVQSIYEGESKDEIGFVKLNGDGTLSCTRREYFLQSWEMPVKYYVNDRFRLAEDIPEYYSMKNLHSEANKVTLLKDLKSNGDAAHPGIDLKKGDIIAFEETDLKEWVKVSKGKTTGWIKTNGIEINGVDAWEYFDGIIVYD